MRVPFSGLGPEAWKRLATIALVGFYAVQAGSSFIGGGLFNPMGLDYMGFWSAGRAANQLGYARAYDVGALRTLQVQQLDAFSIPHPDYSAIPGPLFPIFLVPFQLLALLDARTSFWLWSTLSLLVLILYLAVFVRKIDAEANGQSSLLGLFVLIFLSYPVYQNLYWGQIEVFLLVCCGEFIRNALCGRPMASGLWLGGLLIKPQLLVLVLPALILLKHWRLLAGFVLASIGILLGSLALSGPGGLLSMLKLWFSYLPGIATNAPENMVNWRMLGVRLAPISPTLGWAVVAVGMVFSVWIWYLLWSRRPPFGSARWILMMGGLFSITCGFTWHSHIHMMMVVIPFLIFAAVTQAIPSATFETWVFAFPAVLLLVLIAAAVISLANRPLNGFGGFALGLTGLALNVWIATALLKTTTLSALPTGEDPR